jgi:hypothetical protein
MVILKKRKNTITNENRKNVVNKYHAKFRADRLDVICIFNINDPKVTKQFVNNVYLNVTTRYIVGQTVTSDNYDKNNNNICSNGIHYFLTPASAYFYEKNTINYTGKYTSWFGDGLKEHDGEYNDGRIDGIWTHWHANGYKSEVGNTKTA